MSEGLLSVLCDLGSTMLVMCVTWNGVMLIFWMMIECWAKNLYFKQAKEYIQSSEEYANRVEVL
jgi:hypothetical protein